jgi:hypothetical protein
MTPSSNACATWASIPITVIHPERMEALADRLVEKLKEDNSY